MILGGGYSWPPATAEALLAHAKGRASWRKLTPLQQRRAEELFLTAESPSLLIITADNVALQKKLGWSSGQAQDLVRALKNARLLDVQRRLGRRGEGERGPAAWLYAETDAPRASQLPKRRAKRTDARLRSLQSQTDVCQDEIRQHERMLERIMDLLESLTSDVHTFGIRLDRVEREFNAEAASDTPEGLQPRPSNPALSR
jgi:hypothetical protein